MESKFIIIFLEKGGGNSRLSEKWPFVAQIDI